MSKPAEIARMVKEAEAKFGAVDVLVNNAGIQYVAPIEAFPDDRWDAIIAINLSAAFHATKAALPAMRKKGWGRVINIADRKSTRLNPVTNAHLVCRLLLEKKKITIIHTK